MWIFLCFILDSSSGSSVISSERLKEVTEKMDLLGKFVSTFYLQFLDPATVEDSDEDSVARRCYDAFCLCLLSRLLQIVPLRPLAKDFLISLPAVPASCVQVLFLLLATGSKPDIQAGKANASTASKYRGTRAEALSLLSVLVFHPSDMEAATAALNHLLWNCVSDDFEVRAKTVNNLIT